MATGPQWNRPGCPFVPEPIFLNKWERRDEQPLAPASTPFFPADAGDPRKFPHCGRTDLERTAGVSPPRAGRGVSVHPEHPCWGTQRGDPGFQTVSGFPTVCASKGRGADGATGLADIGITAPSRYQQERSPGKHSRQADGAAGVSNQGDGVYVFPPQESADLASPRQTLHQREGYVGHPEPHRRSTSHMGEEEMSCAPVAAGQKENAPWGIRSLAATPLDLEHVARKVASWQQDVLGTKPSHFSGRSSDSTPPLSRMPSCVSSASSLSVAPLRESPGAFASAARIPVAGSADFPSSSPPRRHAESERLLTGHFPENPVPVRGRLYSYGSCGASDADSFLSKSPRYSSGRVSATAPSPGPADWVSNSHVAGPVSGRYPEAFERVVTPRRADRSTDSQEMRLPSTRQTPAGGSPGLACSNPRGRAAPDASASGSLGNRSSVSGRGGPKNGVTALSSALSVFPFLLPSAAVLPVGAVDRNSERAGLKASASAEVTMHSTSPVSHSSRPRAGSRRAASIALHAPDLASGSVRPSVSTPLHPAESEKKSASHVHDVGWVAEKSRKPTPADQRLEETLLAFLAAATPDAEEDDLRRLQRNSMELDLLLPQVSVTESDAGTTMPSELQISSAGSGLGARDRHRGFGRSDARGQSARRVVCGRSAQVCCCLGPLVSSLHTRSLCDLYEEEAFFLPEQDILEVKFNWWQMLKREFRLQIHWELQQEFQNSRRCEFPRLQRQERLLSRWSYCVSNVSAHHVPEARRLLQEGPKPSDEDGAAAGQGSGASVRGTECRGAGKDGLGAIDVGALLSRAGESRGRDGDFMDCSDARGGAGNDGRRTLNRHLRQRAWTWMWQCAAGLGFCVATRFLGLQLLDAYVAHEQSPVDAENENQASLVAVACLLIAAGLRGHWKDIHKDAYLAGIVRGLDFPYSVDEVIQTQYDILQLLPAGLMLSKTVVDYFRLFLAHLRDLPNVIQHLDAIPPEVAEPATQSLCVAASSLPSSDALGLASRSDPGASDIRVSAGFGSDLQGDENQFAEDLQPLGGLPSPFRFGQSGQNSVKTRTRRGKLPTRSPRPPCETGEVGIPTGDQSRSRQESVDCRSSRRASQHGPFLPEVSEGDARMGSAGALVSLFDFWKCTGLLACLEALILRSCSAVAGSVGPPLLVPPSRLVAALLLRLLEPYSTARMVENAERRAETNGPAGDRPEEPVLGHPGTAAWSRFVCTFVFRLHYDADMVFWKAVLAPLIDGVLRMEDNHCFLALWQAGSEVWARLIARSCHTGEEDLEPPGVSRESSGARPFFRERELSSENLHRASAGSLAPGRLLSQASETKASREGYVSAQLTQDLRPHRPVKRSVSAETLASSWREGASRRLGAQTQQTDFAGWTVGPVPGEESEMQALQADRPATPPANRCRGSDQLSRRRVESGGRVSAGRRKPSSFVSSATGAVLTPSADNRQAPVCGQAAFLPQDVHAWDGDLAFDETMQWETAEDTRSAAPPAAGSCSPRVSSSSGRAPCETRLSRGILLEEQGHPAQVASSSHRNSAERQLGQLPAEGGRVVYTSSQFQNVQADTAYPVDVRDFPVCRPARDGSQGGPARNVRQRHSERHRASWSAADEAPVASHTRRERLSSMGRFSSSESRRGGAGAEEMYRQNSAYTDRIRR
ncbi:conserved hypothetical protein [Neospora caninum Liverpool]|uniref:Cyclin N-terminal domain-containing protein n=1 Tax=Neospora caninum (strain Liverpool) TaxID=572307 RepID=F0VR27_NEOCL|nr:conserved hypothetical protein [Neospora caninum Liverpool]CBZ56174.1 conserved hypothetical protein [Neospora caninum Liverpool]CEL70932.1 TPA: hypothetical protein BN1204_066000 [Neospora caninum Liverpool]|eukprot:XP_003886200.1 conserved hypothetical protein [Neospora caninum Liverpool]